jgi:hypothetical protein
VLSSEIDGTGRPEMLIEMDCESFSPSSSLENRQKIEEENDYEQEQEW